MITAPGRWFIEAAEQAAALVEQTLVVQGQGSEIEDKYAIVDD